jgi:hypothetical protein
LVRIQQPLPSLPPPKSGSDQWSSIPMVSPWFSLQHKDYRHLINSSRPLPCKHFSLGHSLPLSAVRTHSKAQNIRLNVRPFIIIKEA